MLSNAATETETALQTYGKHLGIAFQLVDDALDYSAASDELGKNVGDDLAEGKPTLPLIYALDNGNPEQKAMIRKAIEQSSAENFNSIHQAIVETGALQYTLDQAQAQAEQAKQAIHELPDNQYRQALMFLADYSVERRY